MMLLVVVVAGVLVVVGVVGVVNPLMMFWYVGELALSDRRLGDLPLEGRLPLLIGVMMVGMVV